MPENGRLEQVNVSDELEIGPLTAAPETVEHRRENVRERLAMTLTWAVIGLVVLFVAVVIVVTLVFPDRLDKLASVMTALFTPLVGIYGTVLGFYFGDKR